MAGVIRAARAMLLVVGLGIILGGLLFAGQRYLEERASARVDAVLDALPAEVDAHYEQITLNPLERTAAVHDLRIAGGDTYPSLDVRRVSIRAFEAGTPLPQRLELALADVHWYGGGGTRLRRRVEAAIGGAVVGDARLELRLDPEAERLRVESAALRLHSGDALRLRGTFALPGEATGADFDAPAGAVAERLAAAELIELDARWEDAGLFHGALNAVAAESGLTGPSLAINLLGELEWAVGEWREDGLDLDESLAALRGFLRRGGTIELRARPSGPIALRTLHERALVDPPVVVRRLRPRLFHAPPEDAASGAALPNGVAPLPDGGAPDPAP